MHIQRVLPSSSVLSCRLAAVALGVAAVCSSLSACVPLLIGSGAAAAVVVATDRRTTGMQLEDERIEQMFAQLVRDGFADGARVHATSYNRVVLLTGEVRSAADKERASHMAAGVQNVRTVVNELEVVPMISSVSQRSQDTFITSKVKSSLVAAGDIQANTIKVVTEMDIVYLMGIVTQYEARRAAEIARGVNDVRKVVRVFEALSDEDLRKLQAQNAAQAAQK